MFFFLVLSETKISGLLEYDFNLQLIKTEDAIINDSYELNNRVDENPHIGEQQQGYITKHFFKIYYLTVSIGVLL